MFFLFFLSAFVFLSNLILSPSSHSFFFPFPKSKLFLLFFSFSLLPVTVNLPLAIFLLGGFACVFSLSSSLSSLLFTGLVSSFAPLCPVFVVLLSHTAAFPFQEEGGRRNTTIKTKQETRKVHLKEKM